MSVLPDLRVRRPAPLFRISLAEWSFHKALQSKQMDNLDFARVAKREFGIEAIEYVNVFFKDKARDAAYLAELNRRASGEGVYQHLIMCDGEGALGDPDAAKRAQAVTNHLKWVEAAKDLGCATIRVNAQSTGTPEEQQKLAADGLRRLCEAADPYGINVIVENHGGISSHGDWLAGVMRLVNHPRIGTLPDFGNFYEYDRYQGTADMMPFAKAVSAKSHDFDAAGTKHEGLSPAHEDRPRRRFSRLGRHRIRRETGCPSATACARPSISSRQFAPNSRRPETMTDTSRRDFLSTGSGRQCALGFSARGDPRRPAPGSPRAAWSPASPRRGNPPRHYRDRRDGDRAHRVLRQYESRGALLGTGGSACDVCQPRLAKAKEKAEVIQGPGTVGTYTNYKQLLALPDVHAVLIASPEHWHQQMAEDAILAGKDVYIEKPMTLRLANALRLKKVVEANPDRILNVGTQYVMTPSYGAARDLIKQGVIGKPVWSQTSYCRNSKDGEWLYYEIDPAWQPGVNLDWEAWCGPLGKAAWDPSVYARWRRYRKYSTGIIGDLLVHRITPLIWSMGLGWPVRVTASGGHYVDKVMETTTR
jgi:sugar phosphate isomerase/epimerase